MEDKLDRLYEMCIEIFAHSALDYEIDLAGNGTNASEACNVATEICNIFEFDDDGISNDIQNAIILIREQF